MLCGKEELRVKMKLRLIIQLTLRWGENLGSRVGPMSSQGSLRVGAEKESMSDRRDRRPILLDLKMEGEEETTRVGNL